ncbi:MAG: DUF1998 domain-containing protein [Polyangiaceae bacterium]
MKARNNARPHAQLRRSQVLTTFGPGAMLDLPGASVLISGLESWGDPLRDGFDEIREERLSAKLRELTERPDLRMFAPPVDKGGPGEKPTGIVGWVFPQWFVAQKDEPHLPGVRSRRLLPARELVKGKYFTPEKKNVSVVPVRFVQACVNGHISDIEWHRFVHEPGDDCRQHLWLDERGTSGDLADLFVRCSCGRAQRSLVQASKLHGEHPALGFCRGDRPWLGPFAREECRTKDGKPQPSRLLVRSASNAYFSQTLSVISIPEAGAALKKAVDSVWTDYLEVAEEAADVTRERRKAKVAAALAGFDDAEVWAEVERRKSGGDGPGKSIKQAEIEMLLSKGGTLGEDSPDSTFHATVLVPNATTGPMRMIDRVVLVHRLREVTAQVGFTRFEAATLQDDGELSIDVKRAALAREASWVPAVENRGEGVLLSFKRDALDEWLKEEAVKDRLAALGRGFDAWKAHHKDSQAKMPGPRFLLLHSLSHLLITAVSLSCGYAASSIRERIYATEGGYGILLYTGTPDAEGTLGGLVEVGRDMERHLKAALSLGVLCSNDPVCAQHRPDHPLEERFLHGAACHGCLLIAEPSCERRNDHLDRALVVPTVEGLGAELFAEEDFA